MASKLNEISAVEMEGNITILIRFCTEVGQFGIPTRTEIKFIDIFYF